MAHIVLSMDREQFQATGELLGVWVPETSQETNTSTGPRVGNASRGSRPEQIVHTTQRAQLGQGRWGVGAGVGKLGALGVVFNELEHSLAISRPTHFHRQGK